jgi:cyclic pyranopterin phosphate synthase
VSAAIASAIPLPVLETRPVRPEFAAGPRSLASVRLLRLSVTDRCNLRCVYCMPEGGVDFSDQEELLAPRDFEAVARAAVRIGIRHLKVTGGEPTVRRDIVDIVRRLAALGPHDLSLTTNGLQLHRLAGPLREAGLDRLTLSLDSLRPERYEAITGGGKLDLFRRGVAAAEEAGFETLKINVVVIRGFNDDEVADLAAMSVERGWTVRFIEYMPLGDSRLTAPGVDPHEATLDNEVVKARIAARFGPLEPVERSAETGVGPARVFRVAGARGRLGFISAMSRPFCESCNRLRLTSMGELRSCLFDGGEVDVKPALRPVADESRIIDLFARCVALKPEVHSDRGNRAMSQIGG